MKNRSFLVVRVPCVRLKFVQAKLTNCDIKLDLRLTERDVTRTDKKLLPLHVVTIRAPEEEHKLKMVLGTKIAQQSSCIHSSIFLWLKQGRYIKK